MIIKYLLKIRAFLLGGRAIYLRDKYQTTRFGIARKDPWGGSLITYAGGYSIPLRLEDEQSVSDPNKFFRMWKYI
jgi:hypothetical protein